MDFPFTRLLPALLLALLSSGCTSAPREVQPADWSGGWAISESSFGMLPGFELTALDHSCHALTATFTPDFGTIVLAHPENASATPPTRGELWQGVFASLANATGNDASLFHVWSMNVSAVQPQTCATLRAELEKAVATRNATIDNPPRFTDGGTTRIWVGGIQSSGDGWYTGTKGWALASVAMSDVKRIAKAG